jgi:thiamine biosynthesis lipoprotein
VDIQNPFDEDTFLASFKTTKKNLGISTSGNYRRYVKSKENNHLINPKKKQSQKYFISVTLIGELDSADLDAYTTAACVMPLKKAYEFLDSLGVGYIVLQSDYEIVISKNINNYAKNLLVNYAMKKQPKSVNN